MGRGRHAGAHLPISDFFVAKAVGLRAGDQQPARPGQTPAAHARGLRHRPHHQDQAPTRWSSGSGIATLTAVNGATPLEIADVPGVIVAGVTVDAGPDESPVLLRVGSRHGRSQGLGAEPDDAVRRVLPRRRPARRQRRHRASSVNSDHVLIDHTWVWRADHGVEGLTDTERWNTNIGRNGVVVNGDHVTANGLFVEHFQEYNTVERRRRHHDPVPERTALRPADPGRLDERRRRRVAGYKVDDGVRTHTLHGGGVYVFNRNNPSIHTENGFAEVPDRPGVRLHHIMTVNLGAGTVDHVVNGIGDAADTTRVEPGVHPDHLLLKRDRQRSTPSGRRSPPGPRRRPGELVALRVAHHHVAVLRGATGGGNALPGHRGAQQMQPLDLAGRGRRARPQQPRWTRFLTDLVLGHPDELVGATSADCRMAPVPSLATATPPQPRASFQNAASRCRQPTVTQVISMAQP